MSDRKLEICFKKEYYCECVNSKIIYKAYFIVYLPCDENSDKLNHLLIDNDCFLIGNELLGKNWGIFTMERMSKNFKKKTTVLKDNHSWYELKKKVENLEEHIIEVLKKVVENNSKQKPENDERIHYLYF